MDCSTWELLNLKPATVLNIPEVLYNEYGISQSALAAMMKPFLIQTVGKGSLEKEFKIESAPQFFVGTTKHYSWPKGAGKLGRLGYRSAADGKTAIAGIGSGQIIDVPVDRRARMDASKLREMLQDAVTNQQALYAVVAIIGSTEQGAVDPLTDILQLREQFEKQGLSFVVHCDGAWDGYFATMLREPGPTDSYTGKSSYVPTLALSKYTADQLEAYKHADSITIDPHK